MLWRKVKAGLSAGRVQSVATRLVVERERERMAFRSASYWDVEGTFAAQEDASADAGQRFTARLVQVDGARVASGRDFDDRGQLRNASAVVLDQVAATSLAEGLREAAISVRSVETKPYTRKPSAPFTTSTLQQEASRKLRFSARQTMRTAQTLYENGYITYMRTDSTALSLEAITAARRQASDMYGPETVPGSPRVYASKSKNAQEAHEAIRPSGDSFRTPGQVSGALRGDEFRLYELIWKRTVASQMADAKGSTATVRLGGTSTDGRDAELSASGTVITFKGFLHAYEEGRDEERHAEAEAERRLPDLAQGQPLDVLDLEADGHETSPPPRYTEASLVKALEERGIGRPSTYASTISVIGDRGYVVHRGSALVPSWIAFSVTRLLEENFGRLVDYDFTASMEEDLDKIAGGQQDRAGWLRKFYFGDADLEDGTAVDRSTDPVMRQGLKRLVDDLGEIDARAINSVDIGEGITLRVGKYGPYLEVPAAEGETEPRRANVPDDVAPDELTLERARELLETQGDGDVELGTHPDTGLPVVAKNGRYGPYVTEVLPDDAPKSARPRTGSLLKSMAMDTVTLADAVKLLALPRVVGTDPESGDEITAQNGRYGPYLRKGTDSRSLETEDQIFTVTLEQALAIYAQPKRGRGRTAAAPLRELGDDPVAGTPIVVRDGRFGAYVTDGEYNATLRKDDAVETITLERAAELLADKRARRSAEEARRQEDRQEAAKKTAAKKASAKKTAAKKADREEDGREEDATAKKTAAKKAVREEGLRPARPARGTGSPSPSVTAVRLAG